MVIRMRVAQRVSGIIAVPGPSSDLDRNTSGLAWALDDLYPLNCGT